MRNLTRSKRQNIPTSTPQRGREHGKPLAQIIVAVKKTDEKPKARPGDGTPGPGRPKGVPNKTTAFLKDAILKAAEQAGNKLGSEGMVSYLEAQATENPGPFMALLGKVLPMQVIGDDENPLKVVHRIELVAPSGK